MYRSTDGTKGWPLSMGYRNWSSASCHGVSHSLQNNIQYPSAEFSKDPLDTDQKSNPRSLKLGKKSELSEDNHELVLSLGPTAHGRPGRFWKLRNSAVKITKSLKEAARTSATVKSLIKPNVASSYLTQRRVSLPEMPYRAGNI